MQQTFSERLEQLLNDRGINTETEREVFLRPDYDRDCHDPFLLSDMAKAVDRILVAIEKKERIAVYADFDCDGIPAATILHDLFSLIKYSAVDFYIPHRDKEGFGFHTHAVDLLADKGVTLIVTVDVGSSAHEALARAQARGVDVIVTDHHEFDREPDCFACVHPLRGGYPCTFLCGAGVAYKLAQAVLTRAREKKCEYVASVPVGAEKWMLDMVALATVADMVPLRDENRCLVHFGVHVLRKTRRIGMRALVSACRIPLGTLTEDDIGFSLAPRVNAASRMDDPHLAFRLFTTHSEAEALALAKKLDSLNTKRKATTASITKALKKRIDALTELPAVIVMGSPEWKPALLGSVATALVQTYKRPVCLWGKEETGVLKGSARTDGSASVVELLATAGDVLLHSGGHAGAGGFAIDESKLHLLQERLCDAHGATARAVSTAGPAIQLLGLHEITYGLMHELERLRPFGEGNRKPLWRIHGTAEHIRGFGKDDAHTEVLVANESGKKVRAFRFFMAPEHLQTSYAPGSVVELVGTLERNSFSRGAIEFKIEQIES